MSGENWVRKQYKCPYCGAYLVQEEELCPKACPNCEAPITVEVIEVMLGERPKDHRDD